MKLSSDALSRRTLLAGALAGTTTAALGGWTPPTAQASETRASALGTIRNDTFWHDTDGNPIYSQGGGVFRFGERYYWYGVRYAGAELYYRNPTRMYNNHVTFVSITAYSSTDLVNWKFENDIATMATALTIPPSKDVSGDTLSRMSSLADASWIGRLGVVHNKRTGKYVLITQMKSAFDSNSTGRAVLFLQCDSPTGDFTYADLQTHIKNVSTQATGDQTVFTDDDGSSYLVFSNAEGRQNSYVAKIADTDSLSIEPAKRVGRSSSGREGNAMFKVKDRYYIATSNLHGWNSSHTYLIESKTTDILGEYSSEYILPGTEKDYSHVTQTGFFINVRGTKQDTVIYAGDRWADFAWNGLGYNQWMPLSTTTGGPVFHSLSEWNLNARTGQWATGRGNNYLLNPDFAADRVAVTQPTGWSVSTDSDYSANSFVTNTSPGANGSRFALTLSNPDAFSGAVSQANEVPPGIYRFDATVRTQGGLEYARVRITGSKRQAYVLDLNTATQGWEDVTLEGLRLTSGQATVSVETRSSGGQPLSIDSLALVRTAAC